jgi:hypothetical protein
MVILAALVIAAALVWSARLVAAEIAASRDAGRRAHVLTIFDLFAPAIAAAQQDPRALLVWQPIARTTRALFPEELAQIDRAAGASFPFTSEFVQAAHARWTADWLAWERSHDATYKRKVVEVEHELGVASPALARTRLDAIEHEKLELYQRRYEEYVRVARTLQTLAETRSTGA